MAPPHELVHHLTPLEVATDVHVLQPGASLPTGHWPQLTRPGVLAAATLAALDR